MPYAAFCRAFEFFYEDTYSRTIGVAVSGGGDSMALLDMAVRWAGDGVTLRVATVDHGLRPEAAAEIALVSAYCAKNDIAHDVLVWNDRPDVGNLQAEARRARYGLLEGWAKDHKMDLVLLGHTADDQAETILMNLARGSGVDGLAGMAVEGRSCFVRPLMDATRAQLRDYLSEKNIEWAEDPSNDDRRFARVKARQMMEHLAELGLTQDRILQTGRHMAQAKDALDRAAADFATANVVQEGGDLLIPRWVCYRGLGDTGARVISGAIQWIGGAEYRPRFAAMKDAANAAATGDTRTLGGVVLSYEREVVRLAREVAAAAQSPTATFTTTGDYTWATWDHRWTIRPAQKDRRWFPKKHADPANVQVRALGEAITEVPDWRDTGLPRASLMASPAVFEGETLISAPIAGYKNGFEARIVADFASFLLSR